MSNLITRDIIADCWNKARITKGLPPHIKTDEDAAALIDVWCELFEGKSEYHGVVFRFAFMEALQATRFFVQPADVIELIRDMPDRFMLDGPLSGTTAQTISDDDRAISRGRIRCDAQQLAYIHRTTPGQYELALMVFVGLWGEYRRAGGDLWIDVALKNEGLRDAT